MIQGKKQRESKRTENRKSRKLCGILLLAAALLFTACGSPQQTTTAQDTQEESKERADTGFVVTGPDSFDSADTAVLVEKNEKENTLTFLNLTLGRRYTLSVDGTTRMYDKYGQTRSLEQFEKGDIVDVTFLKSKKHLTTMQLSPSAWSYTDVERYEINTVRKELMIGSETYKLTDNTLYISDNRQIDFMDLNASDVLSFQGLDTQVLSVQVEKGHGYLRLENDENFIGGWIEIGQTQIQQITEDMLLTVPEGSYQVDISNKGGGGTKSVVIRRNEEVTLDIGDLEIPEPQFGTVLFSLNPSSTELYVDGEKVDASAPVSLEYGLHQIIARAEGYQSITQYIRVAQESAGIDVTLDAVDSTSEESSSSSGSVTDTTTSYYKVYIDSPENVEVYLDGNYMGISPCNFKKTSGSHTVTLRKTGYITRSYTVEIDEEAKDLTLSFAGLTPTEDAVVESSATSSANTSSSNTSSANSSSQE